jgi:hypothetical protein
MPTLQNTAILFWESWKQMWIFHYTSQTYFKCKTLIDTFNIKATVYILSSWGKIITLYFPLYYCIIILCHQLMLKWRQSVILRQGVKHNSWFAFRTLWILFIYWFSPTYIFLLLLKFSPGPNVYLCFYYTNLIKHWLYAVEDYVNLQTWW